MHVYEAIKAKMNTEYYGTIKLKIWNVLTRA